MSSLFKAPKAPAPINVAAVGQQQEGANRQAAGLNASYNRVNQFGPFGSTTYAQTGMDASGNPVFSQNTSLDPNELAYRDTQRGTAFNAYSGGMDRLGGIALNRVEQDPTGLLTSGVGRLNPFMSGSGPDTSSDAAFRQAYDTASANIEPRMERARAATENRLRNQGLDPTSEAYKSQMSDLSLSQNEARNDLTSKLYGQVFNQNMQNRQQQFGEGQALFGMGSQEAGRLFGQDQAGAGLAAQTAQSLGSLGRSGLVEAATSTGAPSYAGVSTPGPVDYTGLATANFQQQQNVYNQQVQQRNAMLGGLASIGGSLLAAPVGDGMSVGGSLWNKLPFNA